MKRTMTAMILSTTMALPMAMIAAPAEASWSKFTQQYKKSECWQRMINFSWIRGDNNKECHI